MVHIPYLQLFVDVNRRTSRLGATIPLIRHNLCPLSFIDVPERAYVEGTFGVYEMQKVELLRDVSLSDYERSCRRYMVIPDTTAGSHAVRLRHREALITIVAEIVRGQRRPDEAAVRTVAAFPVPAEDLDAVMNLAMDDLHNHPCTRAT